jgi:hypothetical protein
VLGLKHKGAICRTRDNKVEGERLQEGYLLHFSTVSGAERAQTGVLGCCGAIGAVGLSF